MKKLFTLLLASISFSIFAQKEEPQKDSLKVKPAISLQVNDVTISNFLPQTTIKSPNVSAVAQYGVIPVSLYTGTASIPIPIFDFSIGNLNVPIYLSYSSSGNKVSDRASSVGLGWSLIAGGQVDRDIKGLHDEAELLYNQLPDYSGIQTQISCLTATLKSDLDGQINSSKDIERDIFSYRIPRKSNSFVFVPDAPNYYFLEADKSKVSYSGALDAISLTDEAGFKYDFNDKETADGKTTAWLLNSIQGTKPTEKAVFNYQNNSSITISPEPVDTEVYKSDVIGPGGNAGKQTVTNTTTSTTISSKLLSEIYFPNGKIVFNNSTTNRLDNLGKALNSIEIYSFKTTDNSYSLVKKYVLNQEYLDSRLFLKSVDMFGNDNVKIGTYSCTYNAEPLPAIDSKAKDFWGFSNGQIGNTSLIPAQTFTANNQTYNIGGAVRTPNEDKMKARILTRLTYPTGGFTDFYYQANRHGGGQIVGGLRIEKTISDDGAGKKLTKKYNYGFNQSGDGTYRDIWVNVPDKTYRTFQDYKFIDTITQEANYSYRLTVFSSAYTLPVTSAEGAIVTYPFVTEYDDDGQGANGKTTYAFDDSAFDDMLSMNSSAKRFQKSQSWKRGQLLNKFVYGSDGTIKYKLDNHYAQLQPTQQLTTPILGYLVGKQLVRFNEPLYDGNGCGYYTSEGTTIADYAPIQSYNWSIGVNKLDRTEEYIYDDTNQDKYILKKVETDYNPYFQPKEVRSFDSNGETSLSKYKYVTDYSNHNSNHSGNALALYWMKENNEISTPIEELTFRKKLDNSIRLIGGKFTKFEIKNFSNHNYIIQDNISVLEIPESPIILENAFSASNLNSSGTINIDSRYKQRIDFGNYDDYGNLLNYSLNGGKTNAIGHSTIQSNGVFHNFITSETQNWGNSLYLTTNQTVEKPLLGPTSITAPNGLKTYFYYDNFGRLLRISDHNNHFMKEYEYRYTFGNGFNSIFYNSYIKEFSARSPSTTAYSQNASSSSTANFLDGLGRSIQTINYGATGDQSKNIITDALEFDSFGRAKKSFIPFDSYSGTLIATLPATYETDNYPYSDVTQFDNSPLNRPKKIYGPGQKWRDNSKFTEIRYLVADANTVRKYELNSNGNGASIVGNWNNNLYKTVNISENENQTIEYKDNDGKLIQKDVQDATNSYISTAYVYDDFNRLKYIVQPKLFESGSNFTDSDEFIFGYKFDERSRTVEKKLPSAEVEYLVYDKYDRLVFSQNGLQRHYLPDLELNTAEVPKWQFYKYDGLDRMVYSGIMDSNNSRTTMQNDANDWTGGRAETKSNSSPYYTLGNSFPQISNEADVKAVSFFDNFDGWLPSGMSFDSNEKYHDVFTNNTGLETGSLVRKTSDNSWLSTSIHHDDKGRVIQAFSQNKFGKINKTNLEYNFAGEIITIRTNRNYLTNSSAIELTQNNYDKVGRLRNTVFSIDGVTKSSIEYEYDKVSRLSAKSVYPLSESVQSGNWNSISTWRGNQIPLSNGFVRINKNQTVTIPNNTTANIANIINEGNLIITAPNGILNLNQGKFQKIDYSYNLRSNLKGINLDNSGNIPNSFAENDLFAYKLEYETPIQNPQYDGKIATQSWRRPTNITSPNTTDLRTYTFNYDASNRLKSATYQNTSNSENFGLNNVDYDKNSNVIGLKKYGNIGGNFGNFIDDLSYNYSGNKAINVTDQASANNTVDFTQVGTGTRTYYQDGSLKSDENKGIEGIIYDPFTLQAKEIKMTGNRKVAIELSTDGEVLERKFTTNTTTNELWQYDGGMVFKGVGANPTTTIPYSLPIPEGRLVYKNSTWEQEYQITDHLGNVRVTFKNNNGVAQAVEYNDYDPQGLDLNIVGTSSQNATENRHRFQDKESFSTFGLNGLHDFGARFLDKTIGGIWSQPDILSENYSDISPFNYVFSNPLSFIDPSGMSGVGSDGYSEISVRNTTGAIGFAYFGSDGGPSEDPSRSKSGRVPGAPEKNKINDFASGFSRGLGQLFHDLAPIRFADENDPKTFGEAINNIKNIPSNLFKLPSQLGNVYNNGNIEQKTQATIQTIGTVFAMSRGKAGSANGLMLSKLGVHGNSLKSLKATWGYKLFSNDGTFLKNGITSKAVAQKRYSRSYMLDKVMETFPFKNRQDAWNWEYGQNLLKKGPLNKNMH